MSIYSTLSAFNSKKQSHPQVSGDQPEYIKTKIDARFNETNKTEKSYAKNSYIFTGDISYNFHFLDDYLDIERVIPILSASAKVSTPFQILDIGTGDGAFIQAQTKSNVNVTGIAASTSLQLESIPANQFLVGNAEYLDNINGLNKKYDLIVSAQTVKHFIDPICFIHQAVDRLSNGGYLFVDDFSTPGIEKDIIAISCYLQAQGINIVIDHNMDGIKSLVFQKTQPFQWPIDYHHSTSDVLACYALNPIVLANQEANQLLMLKAISASLPATSLLTTDNDILTILKDPNFAALKVTDKQSHLTACMIATLSPSDFFNLIASALDNDILTKQFFYPKAASLFSDSDFNNLSDQEKENTLKQAVCLDTWHTYQSSFLKEKLGLEYEQLRQHPFNAYNPEPVLRTGPRLTF